MRRSPDLSIHWLGEFLCGLIAGTMSIYSFIGWVPVAFGWVTPGEMLAVCGVIGALLGGYLAAEKFPRKRQKK